MNELTCTATTLDLFEKLKSISDPPDEQTFNLIEEAKKDITPLLLNEITVFADDINSVEKQGSEYIRHVVTLFLLAYFREKKAYTAIIKLISNPSDKVIRLTGEVFTEALGRILASVFNGDLEPIKKVVENKRISSWLRAGALDSLMVLWKENILSRTDLVAYLQELMESKLERKASYVWDAIALIAYDLHPAEIETLLRQAINDKLIAPMVLNEDSLNRCLKNDLMSTIKNKENVVEGFIKEPIKELTWWLYPDTEVLDKGIDYAAMAVPLADKKIIPGERGAPIGWRGDTISRSTKKIGRNDPCFCGSGKKYKKCCGVN